MASRTSAMLVLLGVLAAYVVKRVIAYKRCIAFINDLPGYRGLGPGGRIWHFFIPAAFRGSLQAQHLWDSRHNDYVRMGWDVISNVSYLIPKPRFLVADPAITAQICASRTIFPKPAVVYASFNIYGPNVVTAGGHSWVRHRKISAPTFSDSMLQLAWEQTSRLVHEMFEADWARQGDKVALPNVEKSMRELALLVLMGAAFRHFEDWASETALSPGHSMSFRDSLQTLVHSLFIFPKMPKWLWGSSQRRMDMKIGGIAGRGWLGQRLKEAGGAYGELGRYLQEMAHERQVTGGSETKRDKRDVFSSLVAAMSDEEEVAPLTMEEVFGNMFAFLLAGHETTGHTLTFTLGLLALELVEQDKLFDHIVEVLGNREPSFEDAGRLHRVLAVLYEALRLFPPVTYIPKTNTEDVHFLVDTAISQTDLADITSGNCKRDQKSVFIPKGSTIYLDVAGLHYNPRHWKDPYLFDPSRFLRTDWPKDAFMTFSAGARGCLGRRFAETEAVLVLTLIIRQYRVYVDPSAERPGESKLERRYRLLRAKARISLTPEGVPLVFERR